MDDDLLLPSPEEAASSPIHHRKLKRLKKASEARAPVPPALDPDAFPSSLASPSLGSGDGPLEAQNVPDFEGSGTEVADQVPGSEDLGKEMGFGDGLDPLFPDSGVSGGWEMQDTEREGEREDEGFWGFHRDGGSGGAGIGGESAGLGKGKSAKKRLSLEGEEEINKKKKTRRSKAGELAGKDGKPKEYLREKRSLKKERRVQLDHIHAETQRLLRETRDASFKPVPVVQKPISSVLEKIRLRKLEVLKKSSSLQQSDSIAAAYCSMGEISQDPDLSGPQNEKEYDKSSKMDNNAHAMDVSNGVNILGCRENVTSNKASDMDLEDALLISNNDIQDAFDDSQLNKGGDKLADRADNSLEEDLSSPSLPTSSPKLDPADVSSSEDNDKENIDPLPYKDINVDQCPDSAFIKAFLDDEAEEEGDSDHDRMRLPENEDDDENDEDEMVDDLIAATFEEAPVDQVKRNQLHQKWLEQQDAAATDNVLQRIKYRQKQKEPTLLDDDDDEDFDEDSDAEASYDHPPKNMVQKSSRKARQMIAQMFTDDNDVYVPSDDEETEQALIRQRLSKQTESSFISPGEDEHSKEIFGLIKKLNIAPNARKRGKPPPSNFDMRMMGGNSNSSSKSSFLGRAASTSLPSSRKQGLTTVRTFIFGRDDSNSRSGISTSESRSDLDLVENEPRQTSSPKFSSSQLKQTNPKTKVEAKVSSGSSLFEILRQSSLNFDKQMEEKSQRSSHLITETQAANQFSAFKLEKRIPKLETRY